MDRFPVKTDRGSSRILPLNAFAATAILALIVGCGGGDAKPAPETPTAETATPDTASAEPAQKSLTEGMMLPDDVALPSGEAPDSEAPATENDGPKGLQLPDDLQTTVTPRTAVQLVSTETEESPVDIRYGTWDEISREVAKSGSITVVDLWSLACVPCLREFPHLVELQRQHPDRIRAIGVNVDFDGRERYPAKSYAPRAEVFLRAVKATFPNYLSQTPSEEVLQSAEVASLPAVLVFDANGKLAARFSEGTADGGFNYENDVVPLVQNLLNQQTD
ncbi:TlpA family protein disulfide reductase [Rhodopirellula sallentina]|uniref:Redoxin domain-containing protein n=1 Tax=Rhodopirellula sallentina SM41 TaxID=1263870 RepID=M5UFA1_9BACT|nr:TlpA disulfide reductase family protein [Rhodopirellula sallentina]EMI56526.1 redoxin domain-containing protein [Rhodopirellula sallentina SM41]